MQETRGAGGDGQDAPWTPDTVTRSGPGHRLEIAAVIAACGVGLLLRCLEYSTVFLHDGSVLLGLDDAQFHARRALYSFVNFPAVLDFDWFLAYPAGAAAPVPPLFDWATAGVARLFGSDPRTLETVAAWVSPVSGSLLSWPAYRIGRSMATPGVGVGAAWLSAILPVGILVTRIGNFDHHGAVALIAAGWLAVSLSCLTATGAALAKRSALLAVMIALMLFTWSGSLFYLALGCGAQLIAILLVQGRPRQLFALSASLLAAALPTALWLALSNAPLGGAFSGQTLSWLHVVALLGIATPTALVGLWETRNPSPGAARRLGRFALLAGVFGLPLLALPQIHEPLTQGLSFLAEQDEWAATNPEQLPLFHSADTAAQAIVRLGLFAYAVPLLPLYLAWHTFRAREREKGLILLCWVSALSLLLLSQVRYGTDFTVPGSVAFAMLLGDLRHRLSRRLPPRVGAAAFALLVGAAIAPSVWDFQYPNLKRALSRLTRDADARLPQSSHAVTVRFAEMVRDLTPDPGGFLDASVRPDYGILVPPHHGHRFTYSARRPVPSNNLGPYLDIGKYRYAKKFYTARRTDNAVASVDALGARYVMTTFRPSKMPTFSDHLHIRNETSIRDRPTTGRFRLVAMSPPTVQRDRSPQKGKRAQAVIPYKLFEVVAGATLLVEAEPVQTVTAEIQLVPRNRRAVRYQTLGVGNPQGVALLRVPYPTRQRGEVSTRGLWRVTVGNRELAYEVSEADVLEGRVVRAPADSWDASRSSEPDSPL